MPHPICTWRYGFAVPIDVSIVGVTGSACGRPGLAVHRVEIASAVLVLRVLTLGAAIEYVAETDAPTIVNVTSHAYWNLDGAATIADHHVVVAADEVLPVGHDGIPSGELVAVDDTPLDLRERTRLGTVLDVLPRGVDHCFAARGTPGVLRTAAVLDAPASRRWLAVLTDQPGLQVYTGDGLGEPFVPHGAIAFETQRFPDTPNRPELGSAVLRPGERYSSVTELHLGTGDPPSLIERS